MYKSFNAGRIAGVVAVATSLTISPWLSYDPINMPKMLVLCTGSGLMAALVLLRLKNLKMINRLFLFLVGVFLLALILSFLVNDSPWVQQFFGTWGRSTGLLTYFSFVIVTIFLAMFANRSDSSGVRRLFEKLGYVISFYAIIQLADLDPISWSQKAMVATLGNINFVSSFLGLVSCSFLVRIFLEGIPISSKLFFAIALAANVFLILVSESIQGLAIILTGAWFISLIKLKLKFGKRLSITASSLAAISGFFVFLGSAGIGPLSALRQDTVLYRIDYWNAGWQMTIKNPLFGVGIDSYGDYYREYRDFAAVERTGPQRVTNTAHNIFLDISSGSGLLAGLSFVILLILVIYLATKRIFSGSMDVDSIAWLTISLGFVIFCLISINQIGVGVWGFVSIGMLLSQERQIRQDNNFAIRSSNKQSPKTRGSNSTKVNSKANACDAHFTIAERSFSLLVTCIFLVLSLQPNLTDIKFLSAIKVKDNAKVQTIARASMATDFHREVAIRTLTESGMLEEALAVAENGVSRNPRYWAYWVAIASSQISSSEEKQTAAEKLLELDPNNQAIKSDLANLIARTDSAG